ncbi:MAG: hypothetical protein IGS03_00355 [Candidatus Sericytochromatia bacterium]|nr:hypothetical protein [Candidatus Sericytochromatia bacterium]
MNPSARHTDSLQLDSLSEVRGALLTYTDLHCPPDPLADEGVPQLWVELQSGYLLRIFCANQLLSTPDKPDVSGVFYFVLRCPVQLPDSARPEVQRLLDVLNKLLPFGALELQADDSDLFFRHLVLTETATLDGLLGLDLVLALQSFLPAVMTWLQSVIQQAPLGDSLHQQDLRQAFQALLKQLPPPLQPVPDTSLGPLTKKAPRGTPLQRSIAGALVLSLASTALLGSVSLSLGFFIGGLIILGGCFVGLRRQQQAEEAQKNQKQQQQKQFFWHMLEVETIKLAYQDHALERHRHEVSDKLQHLAQTPIAYPSDIVRLRQQTRFLKQLQSHLLDRSHQLKLQRQELEDNRFQFFRNNLFQPSERPLSQPLQTGDAAEDLLMQNLVLSLSYLDFQLKVNTAPELPQPLVLVYMRPDLPPVRLFWQRQWHPEPAPRHSWMLGFELKLALPQRLHPEEIQALLDVFRRFLPLGCLLLNPETTSLCLRYHFVRLRGDLSTLLVVEILEVLASFGERIQAQLQACQQPDKDLQVLLQETEAAFEALT